ncbi:acyltransferase family protein [Aureimonas ureilytica]|uniref:acyltransferase family protein n=1 Tax=Aureimonas ureilytica TaxID=401562 RepID=UPI0009E6902E|nr:acyltransferase [Aureimonas ureilytica]
MQDGKAGAASFSRELHGARGLFAFLVFVFHVQNSGLTPLFGSERLSSLLAPLVFGVELFFALSGFVIVGTLARASRPWFFLIDRLTRIYPVLWVGVLTVVALSLLSGREAPATYQGWTLALYTLANMAGLPNLIPVPLFLAPAWTLSYELCFYILGSIYLVARRRWAMNLFPLLLILSLPIINTHPRTLFFLSGILVATGYGRFLRIPGIEKMPALALLVFLWSWSSAWTYYIEALQPPSYTLVGWMTDPHILYVVIAFASATLFLDALVRGAGWESTFLRSRLALYFGTISYSFYLWHPVVMALVKAGLKGTGLLAIAGSLSQLLLFLAALPPSIVVAHASQRWLERDLTHFIRRKLRREAQVSARPVQVEAI